MDGAMGVITYGLGTLLGLVLVAVLVFWFIQDITQKKHTVLRNYPVIGRLRYFFENQGEYFRQYFFAGDREEMPFNRATRAWVYRLAKDEGGIIGFGSTNDLQRAGLDHLRQCTRSRCWRRSALPTPPLVIGEGYLPRAVRGALDRQHQRHELRRDLGAGGAGALARRQRWPAAGWTPARAACRPITSRAAATSSCRSAPPSTACATRTATSRRSGARSSRRTCKAFEIKLSQGAKPGKGGVLPGAKVTEEIARIRGIPPARDSISPNRHRDIANIGRAARPDRLAARPHRPAGRRQDRDRRLGVHATTCATRCMRRGLEYAPDFLVIDGGEGGSGAAPQALDGPHGAVDRGGAAARGRRADRVGPAQPHPGGRLGQAGDLGARGVGAVRRARTSSTPRAASCSRSAASRRCAATPTPARPASPRTTSACSAGWWSRRSTCASPTTCSNMNKEIDMIAHSCGLRHARELRREHVRIVAAPTRASRSTCCIPIRKRAGGCLRSRRAQAVG